MNNSTIQSPRSKDDELPPPVTPEQAATATKSDPRAPAGHAKPIVAPTAPTALEIEEDETELPFTD